MTVTYDSGQMK